MRRSDTPLCQRHSGRWLVRAGSLFVRTQGTQRYIVLETPLWLHEEIETVVAVSGLSCRPTVVLVPQTQGIGFALEGLVVLGRQDIEDLAGRIWEQILLNAPYAHPCAPAVTYADVSLTTWRFVIAHEMGHVHQFEGDHSGSRKAWERGADVFAGKVSRHLCWDDAVGRMVAEAVGCSDVGCKQAYASPVGRGNDYCQGYTSTHHPWCANV